jgi:redox-sensitive bicupin YhaK (pirin superfamily)
MAMHPARIDAFLPVHRLSRGTAFEAFGVRGEDTALDPFLMIDHFRMREPTFAAHPHAGFSAVTYLFDDAQTGFRNRDSRGDDSIIRAGDLHWTVAGRGVIHEEVPIETGRVAHGLQLFVNLAAADKHMPPRALHLPRERMPVLRQTGGASVKLGFGAYDDGTTRQAPTLSLPTDVSLLDIGLDAGARFDYPLPAGGTALLLAIEGELHIDATRLVVGQSVAFDRAGGALTIATEQPARAVLLLGAPLREPIVRHGPFAMSTRADLARAIADYQTGRMGRL